MPNVAKPWLRQQYPHLRPEESRLLRHYIDEKGVENLRRLRTQVRVGEGEVVTSIDEPYRELANDLSKWKIDAVLTYPGYTELVELKSRITHTATGQLTGYSNLLAKAEGEPSDFRLTAVGFRSHPDLLEAFEDSPIRIHTIPKADRTVASRD
jgi:hypothetical protein